MPLPLKIQEKSWGHKSSPIKEFLLTYDLVLIIAKIKGKYRILIAF